MEILFFIALIGIGNIIRLLIYYFNKRDEIKIDVTYELSINLFLLALGVIYQLFGMR